MREDPIPGRHEQALFPIVQGGIHASLRREAARAMRAMGDWHGYGIGGLSVGEAKPDMYRILDEVHAALPHDRPRYLMGVGFPEDLVEGVRRGVDLFDCVAPTRMGRNGAAFTRDGRLNIKRAEFRADRAAARRGVRLRAAARASRARTSATCSLADEILGLRLLSLHNVHFLVSLMREARAALLRGTFDAWSARLAPALPLSHRTGSRMMHSSILPALLVLQAGGGGARIDVAVPHPGDAILAIFYFFLIRPQQKQRKKHEARAARDQARRRDRHLRRHRRRSGAHQGDRRRRGRDRATDGGQVTIKSAESRLVVERGKIARIVGGTSAPAAKE